ncbi:cold-shock protein [Roseivirga sp.]|uniref:cold-shock protein n=1 Tax=Roseivirga sp. TaxID=1964215 RepID=UPI003B52DB79
MGRNQNSFIKKQKAEQKRKKKLAKRQKMEDRKTSDTSGKLEDMMAYIDIDGNITTDPEKEASKVEAELERKKRKREASKSSSEQSGNH